MSTCALCARSISSALFSATGIVLPPSDPLNRYCAATFHWDCYDRWPERPQFARSAVEYWVAEERSSRYWTPIHLDDCAYVSVKLHPGMPEVSVRLFKTGTQLRVPLADWERWLEYPGLASRSLYPLEETVLDVLLPRLRQRFPTGDAVRATAEPPEEAVEESAPAAS